MKKYVRIIAVMALPMMMASCTEDSGEDTIEVLFSVTQTEGFDNEVTFTNETPNTTAQWDYEIGESNEQSFTAVLPFDGEYTIQFTAVTTEGEILPTETRVITVTDPDPASFAHEAWELLTNNSEGKSWSLFKATLGPSSTGPFGSNWGEPIALGWWTADSSYWLNDELYFDLDKAYSYVRTNIDSLGAEIAVTESTFNFDEADSSLYILGENQMAVRDATDEMAEENKSRYKLYYINSDTLIVGQGAYYTADRPDQDWGFYHWYVAQ